RKHLMECSCLDCESERLRLLRESLASEHEFRTSRMFGATATQVEKMRRELERQWECGLINMRNVTDSRGLKIFLRGGPDSYSLGSTLRELAAMTGYAQLCDGVTGEGARANTARNCLLVAQAYEAACQLEQHLSAYHGRVAGESVGSRGVVFGHAR